MNELTRMVDLAAAEIEECEAGAVDRSEDIQACRDLWAAVLGEQWKVATVQAPSSTSHQFEVDAARNWFGGRDFRIVCDLAGLDPDYLMAGIAAYLDRQNGVSDGGPCAGQARSTLNWGAS